MAARAHTGSTDPPHDGRRPVPVGRQQTQTHCTPSAVDCAHAPAPSEAARPRALAWVSAGRARRHPPLGRGHSTHSPSSRCCNMTDFLAQEILRSDSRPFAQDRLSKIGVCYLDDQIEAHKSGILQQVPTRIGLRYGYPEAPAWRWAHSAQIRKAGHGSRPRNIDLPTPPTLRHARHRLRPDVGRLLRAVHRAALPRADAGGMGRIALRGAMGRRAGSTRRLPRHVRPPRARRRAQRPAQRRLGASGLRPRGAARRPLGALAQQTRPRNGALRRHRRPLCHHLLRHRAQRRGGRRESRRHRPYRGPQLHDQGSPGTHPLPPTP